jgi:hypothetical protein
MKLAIIKALPGLQVTIQSISDNKDLPEYPDEGEWTPSRFKSLPDDKRTSSYVECVSDTEFRVCSGFGPSFNFDMQSFTIGAIVDGQMASRKKHLSCTSTPRQRNV